MSYPKTAVVKFVRAHLDDANHTNGAVEIAVGDHTSGILRSENAMLAAIEHPVAVFEAKRGDLCILKMLGPAHIEACKDWVGQKSVTYRFLVVRTA